MSTASRGPVSVAGDARGDHAGRVLLTGATGFIGMELLARYLERTERPLTCIVRAASDAAANARIAALLDGLVPGGSARFHGRIQALCGDMTAPGLGVHRAVRERLLGDLTTIVHCAASVSFDLELGQARAINVAGTRRVLELAAAATRGGRLRRYAHVSTAYVAGVCPGSFSELDLDLGQAFHNPYEQSKFESEQLVRGADELPWLILRPSIVVGERDSGWTSSFNVLYWPLRMLSTGRFKTVPALAGAPVDVVPVDYVADAIFELIEDQDVVQQTFHLTAGPDTTTFGEILAFAARYFNKPAPVPVPPERFQPESAGVLEAAIAASRVYFPYFASSTVFDNTRTRARLLRRGIEPSPLGSYLERLLDFATLTHWGKRPVPRAQARRSA